MGGKRGKEGDIVCSRAQKQRRSSDVSVVRVYNNYAALWPIVYVSVCVRACVCLCFSLFLYVTVATTYVSTRN